MAAKRSRPDPNAEKYLLFVDTTIWLDFYRIKAKEGADELLRLVEHAKNRIIMTDQVQMEFMKNRQNQLLLMLEKFKSEEMTLPPILADRKAAQALRTQKKAMDESRTRLRKHVDRLLMDPGIHDPVFKLLNSLFSAPTDLTLCRPKDERNQIRELAEKRWKLGYPPRKPDDTSMGDAINWEWVVDCAIRRGGHVIIVSGDKDYGRAHGGQVFLNDWLKREYKERVPGRTKIVLTNHLSSAFSLMNVRVPKEVIVAEASIVQEEQTLSATATALEFSAVGDAYQAVKVP